MTLTLDCQSGAENEARAFIAALLPTEPEVTETKTTSAQTRDAATVIALATLALTVPGAVLATLQIKDHLDRRKIKKTLEALKAKLAEADGSARLTLPSGASIDLTRTSTDAAIDQITEELGEGS